MRRGKVFVEILRLIFDMYGQVLQVKRWQLVSSSIIRILPHDGQKNNIIVVRR